MASSTRINFKIAFEGSAQCWKDADVGAIDLVGPTSEVSARSSGAVDSSLHAGRLKWCLSKKDTVSPYFQAEKFVDQIALTPEIAKTIKFTARVFEYYENKLKLVKGADGILRPELRARRHDIPIVMEDHAELEEGASYIINVRNVGERSLRASFIKIVKTPTLKPKESKVAEESKNQMKMDSSPGFQGWLDMVETLSQSSRVGDPELDSLTISELQDRFDEGITQLEKARQLFKEACNRKEGIEEALAHKQSVSGKLIKLEAALHRKRVIPS